MCRKIIDLSTPASNETDGVTITLQDKLPVYMGHECYAYDLAIRSHTGTYFETSSHVFRGGKNTSEVPLEKLIAPAVCISVSGQGRCIYTSEIEKACGHIDPGRAILINFHKRTDRYFPRDAAAWMAEKKVVLMGSNTKGYDSGFENPTGFFVELFKAEIPIIANLKNLEKLPKQGFTLVVLPLSIEGICTVPCRAAAIIE
ncbi:MAG: cyclase family protein [Planctomycetota bacterium]